MLVECGLVRATTSDGLEFTFRPSLGRIAALGHPQEIVELFAGLHGPKAASIAPEILAALCDEDDPTPLIGWPLPAGAGITWAPGAMPQAEQIVIARHLMRHGIVGTAKPEAGDGKFTDRFDASEYVAFARVHLGLSSADAEALSMTEFQQMLEMKYPSKAHRDVPTREEYEEQMAAFVARRAEAANEGARP